MSLPSYLKRHKKPGIQENLANHHNHSSSSWEQKFRNHTGKITIGSR
jgi:hypothetical protein